MVDFAKYRKSGGSNERLKKALESNQSKFKRDERYYQPTVDKAGNGFSVIRFLPAPPVDGDEALEYVSYWSHSFKGPSGKWYIENSLTTLDLPDPVAELNKQLWDTGSKVNQDIVRGRKRKLNFVSNILVVKDPAHPENEGKVFLFTYGVKIMDKIKEKLGMEVSQAEEGYVDPDDVKFDPFHLFEGADFKLKIRKVGEFRNYDKSEFASPSEVFNGDEDKLEKLLSSLYSLKSEVAPDKFKSYDELKKRLNFVLGSGPAATGVSTRAGQAPVAEDDAPPSREEVDTELAEATAPTGGSGDDEDAYAAFARLAEG